MAAKNQEAFKQFALDVDALSAHEPRRRAIQWLMDGHIDLVERWVSEDGCVAAYGSSRDEADDGLPGSFLFRPLPLDRALARRFAKALVQFGPPVSAAWEKARGKIERLHQSPLEMLIKSGSDAALGAALELWSAPARRFSRGGRRPDQGAWTGWVPRICGEDHPDWRIRDSRDSALGLALLLGRMGAVDAMVRSGMGPEGHYGWDELSMCLGALREVGAAELKREVGLNPDIEAARSFAWDQLMQQQDLDEALPRRGKLSPEQSQKARELLDAGAQPRVGALVGATESGDGALVAKAFSCGADPNGRDKAAAMAQVKIDLWTEGALREWLRAGGNFDAEGPSGDDDLPTLYRWCIASRLDCIKLVLAESAGAIRLRYMEGGKMRSPMLALALDMGHEDIALWLVESLGCSLGDHDGGSSKLCSDHGSDALRARVLSAEEKRELDRLVGSHVAVDWVSRRL
jgi:hypothetical protein